MKLSDFMREKGMRDKRMGELVGLSESQISRIRRGKSVPSRQKMSLFMSVTAGKVTPNDFADLPAVFDNRLESPEIQQAP